ncbi:MAG: Skp family chaperone for outer membrane protein, partial [Rhodothermales bacterium]
MNFRTKSTRLATLLTLPLLLAGSLALAETPEADEKAGLQAAYEAEVTAARQEQREALESIERARSDMLRAVEEQSRQAEILARARSEHSGQHENSRQLHEAESKEMREELSRVHESLRQASREVARVHRDLDRTRATVVARSTGVNLGDRAVIGVVLGNSVSNGVPILGVSPDGPSERAGLQQGDVIVAMMGTPLADGDNKTPRAVLSEVMVGVKVGDEIVITVDRDGENFDHTVVADKREPFSWQSIVRLPSAPAIASRVIQGIPVAPSAPVVIDRINIPEIDLEELHVQVERMREDVENVRVVIETGQNYQFAHSQGDGDWEFEFESLSEIGDDALREANVWFGLPVTRGLKLAEVDEGLGEYFKTDRGVLVLEAPEDNDLQLKSGDVILQVGGKS